MSSSIKLFDGAFGHVSILNVANDLVTHAHEEVHIIIWLAGTSGEMTVGDVAVDASSQPAAAIASTAMRRARGLMGG